MKRLPLVAGCLLAVFLCLVGGCSKKTKTNAKTEGGKTVQPSHKTDKTHDHSHNGDSHKTEKTKTSPHRGDGQKGKVKTPPIIKPPVIKKNGKKVETGSGVKRKIGGPKIGDQN